MGEQAILSWGRTELWGDFTVCVDRGDDGGLRLQVLAASAGHGDWLHEAESWFTSQGITRSGELLIAPGLPFGESARITQDLNEETCLRDWLTAWASEVMRKAPGCPLLRPPSRPMTGERRFALAAIWAAVAVLFCAGHWFWMKHYEKMLQQELRMAQEPARRIDAIKARAKASEAELANARQQLIATRQLQRDWETVNRLERHRHAVLLHVLADIASDDFVLQSVTESVEEMRITVLALRPELPDFTARLGAAMDPLGWHVGPPNRQALNLMADGGPWQLKWTLRASDTTNSWTDLTHDGSVNQSASGN